MYFDQWSAIYTKYTVLSSQLKVVSTYVGTTNVNPCFLGVNLSTSSTSPSSEFKSTNALLASPYTLKYIERGALVALGEKYGTFSCSWNAATFFGVDSVRDGSIYSAATNDNPATEAYYHVFAAPIGGNTYGEVNMIVTILYDVVFRDPRIVDGS
jgi:hypothetical protein